MTNKEKAFEFYGQMDKNTKISKVLKHLIDNGSISSMEAFERYKATRLSAIIFSLRNAYGIEIKSVDKKSKDGTKYVKYTLV